MHWHKYGNWSEVKRDTGTFENSSPYQTRECKGCGRVQRRWL